jgi:hypothetical protein
MIKYKRIHPVISAEEQLSDGDHIQIVDPDDDRYLWEGIYKYTFTNHENKIMVMLELLESGLHCPIEIDKVHKVND